MRTIASYLRSIMAWFACLLCLAGWFFVAKYVIKLLKG